MFSAQYTMIGDEVIAVWEDWFDESELCVVEPLVRCRDCKYWIDNLTEDNDDEDYSGCRWDWERRIPKADDYCSMGERKDQ